MIWVIVYLVVGSIIAGLMIAIGDKLQGFTFANPDADDFCVIFAALLWPIVLLAALILLVAKLTVSVIATLKK